MTAPPEEGERGRRAQWMALPARLGPGVLVTVLSTLVAMYFLLPPAGWKVEDPADLLSLIVFILTSLVITFLYHRLHVLQGAQRDAVATATARAERLDAIVNTTGDGLSN